MPKSFGFTLVELMIAVAIIATLTAIAIPAYQRFTSQSRDAKRQSDAKLVQSALEQYKLDQGFYPNAADLPWGAALTSPSGSKIYNNKLPKDPFDLQATHPKYLYRKKPDNCNNTTIFCSSYCLFVKLEGSSTDRRDACVPSDPQGQYSIYLTP